MKNLIIMFLLISSLSFGQNRETKNLSLIQSPGSLDDGISFGLQFDQYDDTFYYGGEFYNFPELNDLDYTHLVARFGLNHSFRVMRGILKPFRIYAGARLGGIIRVNRLYTLIGLEAGIHWTIPRTNIFLGLAVTTESKTDSKYYSNEDYHNVNSGLIKLGFTF